MHFFVTKRVNSIQNSCTFQNVRKYLFSWFFVCTITSTLRHFKHSKFYILNASLLKFKRFEKSVKNYLSNVESLKIFEPTSNIFMGKNFGKQFLLTYQSQDLTHNVCSVKYALFIISQHAHQLHLYLVHSRTFDFPWFFICVVTLTSF